VVQAVKPLQITQFGEPVLRTPAKLLSKAEIMSADTQELIVQMRELLARRKLGVGLAAPQVGRGIALAIIAIQPTKHRPEVEPFEAVLINPVIVAHSPRRRQMWEGCISGGSGSAGLFAKVPRYSRVQVRYYDEEGAVHDQWFTGLPAQVAQHEIDHLNGTLFVDRVKDTTSYMTVREYKKMVRYELSKK
jgi:peptide deformylase